MDIASEVCRGDEKLAVPPFLVLGTDGIWDETSANTVVDEVRVTPFRCACIDASVHLTPGHVDSDGGFASSFA